jgi:spermidine synthase
MEGKWVYEELGGKYRAGYRVRRKLFEGESPHQKIEIYETEAHGRMLFNDGLAMLSERDEFVYHEMIAHVPLFVHPCPKKVLVIGGGDGGTAREVLRHPGVEVCVMVEIDAMVVEACSAHLPQTACVFGHPKLDLRIEDGLEFVANTDQLFDVVLIDSTDPVGPAQPLFGSEFYGNLVRCLGPNGIVVSQGENPHYHREQQAGLRGILNRHFPLSRFYNYHNLTYPGGLWSFAFSSFGLHPLRDFGPERVDSSGLSFDYYSPAIHRAAFALPAFMLRSLSKTP